MLTKDKLYKSSLDLYRHKDDIEKHLSHRTNELFDLEDKIILYDLTNTYFEGTKTGSKVANFGRSKEKRSDAKLVVLALVCNVEGFIKYSSILEGNIADSATLGEMIDKLAGHTCSGGGTVVIDAGIATKDNLALITAKGFKYLCVSNTQPKGYTVVVDRPAASIKTKSGHNIALQAVSTPEHTDYFLEVKSPLKKAKEQGMKSQFESRFEDMLKLANKALSSKSGIKKLDKVHERIGRAREKYPSVAKYYDIAVKSDKKTGLATQITWEKNAEKETEKNASLGRYFLRTNLDVKDEAIIWNIYNTIREIETVFRTLKTDLDLRPIYHKNDDATMAHLHLGILAYWLVNTIRFQLKRNNINSQWKEIVRIGNTQKMITTTGTNESGVLRQARKCSEPDTALKNIYKLLGHKSKPFTKRKSVVHKPTLKKNENQPQSESPPI
jgi:transposase